MSKELTLDELALLIKEMQDQGLGSWKVMVPVIEASLGPSPCVGVADIAGGFDWNSGRVFLQTTESVKRVQE